MYRKLCLHYYLWISFLCMGVCKGVRPLTIAGCSGRAASVEGAAAPGEQEKRYFFQLLGDEIEFVHSPPGPPCQRMHIYVRIQPGMNYARRRIPGEGAPGGALPEMMAAEDVKPVGKEVYQWLLSQ